MWRFLLPALVMVGALIVLFAGALGNFQSLPNVPSSIPSTIASLAPERAREPANASPPPEPPAAKLAEATQQEDNAPPNVPGAPAAPPALDALQRQASDLQAQISQRTKELASLQGDEGQARQELDALHQQRAAEQAAFDKLKEQESQASNPPPQAAAPAPPQPQPQPATSTAPPIRNEMETTLSRLRAEQKPMAAVMPHDAPAQPARRQQPRPTAAPSPLPEPETAASAWTDLLNARTLLASGRNAEARQTLMRAQAQSVLRPVTPDQPYAAGDNATAIRIRDAIRMLDSGSTSSALRDIDLAMNSSRDGTSTWPTVPPPPPFAYGYPATSNYYYSTPNR